MSSHRFKQLLDACMIVAAIVLLVPLALLWMQRLTYPFDLEWMEGGMLAHAWRLRRGLPIYDASAADFIPFIYPPGYAAVLAALSTIFPLDYALARAVSLAGTLAAAGAIVWCVARHFRDFIAGFVGAALFLLCYGSSGGFYDLARVDGLAIGLLAWSIVLGAEKRRGALEVAAVLLCLAYLVKHSFAVLGLPMVLGIWARDGFRKALRFGLLSAVPALAMTVWLQVITHGGFGAYVIDVPRSHPFHFFRAFPGTVGEIALLLGPAWSVVVGLLVVRGFRASTLRWPIFLLAPVVAAGCMVAVMPWLTWPVGVGLLDESIRVFALVLVGASLGAAGAGWFGSLACRSWSWPLIYGSGVGFTVLAVTAIMRGHHGGYLNVLIPAHWAMAFAMAIACARFRSSRPSRMTYLACVVLWGIQLGMAYERNELAIFTPSAIDEAAGRVVVAQIRRCPRPVFSPLAPWLPVQAGLEPSTHIIAISDIDHPGSPRRHLVSQLRAAAQNHHWGCIVGTSRFPLIPGVDDEYPTILPFSLPEDALWPRSGWQARPEAIRLADPQ